MRGLGWFYLISQISHVPLLKAILGEEMYVSSPCTSFWCPNLGGGDSGLFLGRLGLILSKTLMDLRVFTLVRTMEGCCPLPNIIGRLCRSIITWHIYSHFPLNRTGTSSSSTKMWHLALHFLFLCWTKLDWGIFWGVWKPPWLWTYMRSSCMATFCATCLSF